MLTNFLLEAPAMSVATKNIGITNLGQISINVRDLERATSFYRDVLGLPLLFTAPNLAFFDCGGVRLMLGRAETPELDHPSSILYFRVTEIKAAHQRLLEMGVQFLNAPRVIAPMPTHDLWMAAFRDSEGNIMQLMSEVPR
jgi:predicted enzyme related to lactoylglutathione lyase